MKMIYVVYCETTSWNSITGESTVYKNIEKAYFSEDAAKEFCKDRNFGHITYAFGHYDYESCDLEEN